MIERASVLFQGSKITSKHVRENLLRLKVPNREEEQSLLWDATADLLDEDEIKNISEMENRVRRRDLSDHEKDLLRQYRRTAQVSDTHEGEGQITNWPQIPCPRKRVRNN